MFGNKKKNTLPPRPTYPTSEQMLSDLQNATEDDVVFSLLKGGKKTDDITNLSPADSEDVYTVVKTFLDLNKKLIVLKDSIQEEELKLKDGVQQMNRLSEDLKEQAQAALIR